MRVPDNLFVRLAQPRFHHRGHKTGDHILARAEGSLSSVFRGGNAGNAVSDSNHRNLLPEQSSDETPLNLALTIALQHKRFCRYLYLQGCMEAL
jgi:hypothetical protein